MIKNDEKKGWFVKLKNRWGVSGVRVIIILVVFALTGTTVLFIKTPILDFIVGESQKNWIHSTIYFVLILPIYNVLLLIYGAIFGQFTFFWEFEKKFFKRMFSRKKESKAEAEQ